jgi:hypothetical protein
VEISLDGRRGRVVRDAIMLRQLKTPPMEESRGELVLGRFEPEYLWQDFDQDEKTEPRIS